MNDLEMYRGDDRTITVTASESLTGSDVRFTAKWSRHADAEVIIAKTSDDTIVIDDTVATVPIDAVDTEDLRPGPLYWDVEVTDGAGKVHTVAVGRLTLLPDVTHLAGS